MSVSKNSQAGSATSFVIIAIILVVITIGAVAFVVQRGNQARKDAEIARIAEQEAQQAAKDAEAAKNAQNNKPVATNPDTSGSKTTPRPSSALPETGTELDIVRILAMALLTYGAVAFVSSRRRLGRSL
jgi:type II secretory pathway pseudopilin PulG